MRFLLSVFVLFVLFVLTVSWTAEDNGPAIWRVSDDDTTINIFGTVHLLKPGTVWLDAELQAMVSSADTIYLELSPEQQSLEVLQPLIQNLGMLSPEDSLKNHLTASQYEKITAKMTALGIPTAGVNRMKPWLAGLTYAGLQLVAQGYEPASGSEATFTDIAKAQGITIKGLETALFQMSLFSSMTPEEVGLFIDASLDQSVDVNAVMEEMTAAWMTGELEELDELFNALSETDPSSPDKFITERNKNWVGSIKSMLDEPGNFFVAVGMAHLLGDKSVVALLPLADIRVERLR